jgi:hypothetical protein
MSTPRISDERLAWLGEAHTHVKIHGAGAWDGMDLNDLLLDLRDARARIAELERDLQAHKQRMEAEREAALATPGVREQEEEGQAHAMSAPQVNQDRAVFVYEAARLAAIAAKAPVIPAPWVERELDFRAQFLQVIERQCGPQRSSSPEELHGSWVQAYLANGWMYGETYDPEARRHPDLVPYAQLGRLEKDKDAVFIALCEIARQWIREPTP